MSIGLTMHRNPLKKLLLDYQSRYPSTTATEAFIRFVNTHSDCFERSLQIGHVTGSAWIVDPAQQKALLVHHKKLDLWLQPGGHCDGNPDVAQVAQKEVEEETGLSACHIFSASIFDLDIHAIPPHKGVAEHLHFDVRFLIHADSGKPITASEESHAIQWFDLDKIGQMTRDASVIRMVEKTCSDPFP